MGKLAKKLEKWEPLYKGRMGKKKRGMSKLAKMTIAISLIAGISVVFLLTDFDGDGLKNMDEFHWGANIFDFDSDHDGLGDGEEVYTYSSDPACADTDADGLDDGYEVSNSKTSPSNSDTDGDGLNDGLEVKTHRTNPLIADTDGDGLTDGDEVHNYHTSPTNPDSDFDGLTDGDEVLKYTTDPLERTTFFSGVDEYGNPFTVWNLEFNTPGVGINVAGLDIVFVSGNFALDEIIRFGELVDDCYRTLLTIEPFSRYRDIINVWRIETVADFEPERPDPDMPRLLVVNGQKVRQFVEGVLFLDLDFNPPDDHIIVFVDTPTYGGSGGNPSVAYTGELAVPVIIHEFGHGFGGLGDEYVVCDEDFPSWEEVPWPNVDWDGSKWRNVPGTGAYKGAVYRNLVRPTYDGCIMGSILCPGFCPVCEMHLASLLEGIRVSYHRIFPGSDHD